MEQTQLYTRLAEVLTNHGFFFDVSTLPANSVKMMPGTRILGSPFAHTRYDPAGVQAEVQRAREDFANLCCVKFVHACPYVITIVSLNDNSPQTPEALKAKFEASLERFANYSMKMAPMPGYRGPTMGQLICVFFDGLKAQQFVQTEQEHMNIHKFSAKIHSGTTVIDVPNRNVVIQPRQDRVWKNLIAALKGEVFLGSGR